MLFIHNNLENCPLPALKNGSVIRMIQQESIAIFKCNPEFLLVGSSTRFCQSDGQWDGAPSKCLRK